MSLPEDRWDDEWNRDDWYELGLVDRETRNEESWRTWVLKLVALAIAVPIVLGILALLLILAL